MLIGARFVQGVGGALASAVVLGMIVTMFPEPREQAKAIGVYGFVASAGGSMGLLAGGVLAEAINWHWIFFINVPIGIATAVYAVKLVGDTKGIGIKAGADLPGAVLLTAGLMLGVYTILQVTEQGWGSTQTLALAAVSLALIAAFVARQARIPNPLMPLRLFRSRSVVGANIVMALQVAGMFSMEPHRPHWSRAGCARVPRPRHRRRPARAGPGEHHGAVGIGRAPGRVASGGEPAATRHRDARRRRREAPGQHVGPGVRLRPTRRRQREDFDHVREHQGIQRLLRGRRAQGT
jgi:hypothetical protein